MRRGIACVSALVALALVCEAAAAAEVCLRKSERLALKMAAVQEQLMVAALSCHAAERYNSFMTTYRPELQSADDALQAYFVRGGGMDGYHAFKTHLANASSLTSIGDAMAYCRDAVAEFDMALAPAHGALRDFLPVQLAPDLASPDCADDLLLAARNAGGRNLGTH